MRLHHYGVAVRSIENDAPAYCQALGLEPPGHVWEDPVQQVRVAFAPAGGGVQVEFIEPAGESSPVRGVIAGGRGLYHVCFEVDDLDAALAELGARGARTVSPPAPAAAFDGRRIAFVFLSGNLIELLEA